MEVHRQRKTWQWGKSKAVENNGWGSFSQRGEPVSNQESNSTIRVGSLSTSYSALYINYYRPLSVMHFSCFLFLNGTFYGGWSVSSLPLFLGYRQRTDNLSFSLLVPGSWGAISGDGGGKTNSRHWQDQGCCQVNKDTGGRFRRVKRVSSCKGFGSRIEEMGNAGPRAIANGWLSGSVLSANDRSRKKLYLDSTTPNLF